MQAVTVWRIARNYGNLNSTNTEKCSLCTVMIEKFKVHENAGKPSDTRKQPGKISS